MFQSNMSASPNMSDDEQETTGNRQEATEDPSVGNEIEDPNQRRNGRKRYLRHTKRQIEELEACFKRNPHPDDKQRKELSRTIRLKPHQVKFWFQNKRTQMKSLKGRRENQMLKSELDEVKAERDRYKEALQNVSCPDCRRHVPVGEMSLEDLREELGGISSLAPLASQPPPRSLDLDVGNFRNQSGFVGEIYGAEDILRSYPASRANKIVIVELAFAAMEELLAMARAEHPLWIFDDNSTEILNEEEYFRTIYKGTKPKPLGLRPEASRESAVVIMNPINLIEILMDVNQWSTVFSGIVSRASTLEVFSTGDAGTYNDALQVMTAEFQVPSPLVPTRENYFARLCRQLSEGAWAVVDVPLDGLRPRPISRTRRRPSGCIIQASSNGYSKVTWIEHAVVDDTLIHNMYKPLIQSGLAFGAKRWLATLIRQCERLASSMASNIPAGNHSVSPRGRKGMLKLAETMVMSFCSGVGASTAHSWTTMSATGFEDVNVKTRKSLDDPRKPQACVLSAATSFWIQVAPKRVFDFLRDENSRSQWDFLSYGGVVTEIDHIANGSELGNCVSLLRVNSSNSSPRNMIILQESCTDETGSYLIYAPVDNETMNVILSGGESEYAELLPSGFAILPDGLVREGDVNQESSCGSLVTVTFQILVESVPTAELSLASVATVNSLVKTTVEKIKAALCL